MSKPKTITKRDARSLPVTETELVMDSGDDAPDIPPVLSESEWLMWRHQRLSPVTMMREVSAFPPNPDNLCKTIAIANDQLHDEDPRKVFRREAIALLRLAAQSIDEGAPIPEKEDDEAVRKRGELYSQLFELADAIESYLPKESANAS